MCISLRYYKKFEWVYCIDDQSSNPFAGATWQLTACKNVMGYTVRRRCGLEYEVSAGHIKHDFKKKKTFS